MAVFERRYLKEEYQVIPQSPNSRGFRPGSTVNLLPAEVNHDYFATSAGANPTRRDRLEKSGMIKQAWHYTPSLANT
ncbi:MAG: hypothetical protein KAV87_65100 [Desulfobacteraceae bacterium]|nr:hypothetical protein [Desulfobacteraceae bacterium]